MTVLEALTWGEGRLRTTLHEKRFPSMHHTKLDAQILLAFALRRPTKYLAAHLADPIEKKDFDVYHRLITRRMRHEPVAHLTGIRGFYDRDFLVNAHTLIPRPETELLVEEGLRHATDTSVVIDVGTGSGAIAITVAAHANLPVFATDTNAHALAIARQNAQASGVDHLISFFVTSLLGNALPYLGASPHLLILANLPYVPLRVKADMDPDVLLYEPHEAIFAGVDGLDAYDALLQEIKNKRTALPKRLTALFEIDPSQTDSLPRLVRDIFPRSRVEIKNDLARLPRLAVLELVD